MPLFENSKTFTVTIITISIRCVLLNKEIVHGSTIYWIMHEQNFKRQRSKDLTLALGDAIIVIILGKIYKVRAFVLFRPSTRSCFYW